MEQFNKEECQESSSAEKYRSFEHNGMEVHNQEGMEGFQEKENTFVERKAMENPIETRQETREADRRRWVP